MKTKLLTIFILTVLISISCYAQVDKYQSFHDYLSEHCKAPKSVTDQCGWQFAMVKLITDKGGRVISYSLLNQASDSLKLTFKPIVGYRFPAELKMQNKTFVFARTYYNLIGKCRPFDSPDVNNVFQETYRCLLNQLQLNPKTIFDEMIFGSMLERSDDEDGQLPGKVIPIKPVKLY